MITTQIHANPIDILNAPDSIKHKYTEVVLKEKPAVAALMFGADDDTWEKAAQTDPDLIIYAPNTLDNWEERVIEVLTTINDEGNLDYLLLKAPPQVSKNYSILSKSCAIDGRIIQQISSTVPNYYKLCKIAVVENPVVMKDIPDEVKDYSLCKAAID